jgi:hypothetical protein
MKLSLRKRYDCYAILNEDAYFIVGRVYPCHGQQGPYRVTSKIGSSYQRKDIAVVKSLDDVIPAFTHYYEKNPVPWEQEKPALHLRNTMFACLRVELDQQGHWLAYRDDYPLLRDTKPARFATCADARRAADAHELDLFPDAKVIDDSLSWLPDPEIDWRSVPYLAEELLAYLRSASSSPP